MHLIILSLFYILKSGSVNVYCIINASSTTMYEVECPFFANSLMV